MVPSRRGGWINKLRMRVNMKLFKMTAAAAFFAAAAACLPAQANVLTNGDFQSGLTGWTSYVVNNGTENGAVNPTVVNYNVTGSGASIALSLAAGQGMPGPFGPTFPAAGGGVQQSFATAADGVATFSVDIAQSWLSSSPSFALGTFSALLDDVTHASCSFPAAGANMAGTIFRNNLSFTTALLAGTHTI